MKSIFLHLVILTSVISLASCSSTDSVLNTDADITVLRIGDEELSNMANEVSQIYEDYNQSLSRSSTPENSAVLLSQAEAKIAQRCEPLTNEGMRVRDQLVQIEKTTPQSIDLSQDELAEILAMTDDQLALCALQLNALSEYEEFVIQLEERQIASELLVDCLLQATGISNIVDVLNIAAGGSSIGLIVNGTKAIINAKTVKQLLLGFAKRYIGWIGVGYMLYEFGTCVNNGQQS